MKKRTSIALIAATFVAATSAQAVTTLIAHNFGGDDADPLNGATVSTVNITGAATTWVADGIIRASGQVNDGTNTDRGAYIDLGATFSFSANNTYTLTLGWTNLDNAILLAGFMNNAPNVGAQIQTQNTHFGMRARGIPPAVFGSVQRSGATLTETNGTIATTATGSVTLTLDTNSLTDATFTVDGVAASSVNLSAVNYRYLWIAFEDPVSATPASDARFTSVNFTLIPEPSAALLGSVGVLLLLRRRR